MIHKIVIENFKKFEKVEINLKNPTVLFVGQNNGGKTTALQALGLWSFLTQQWKVKKGQSRAKKRTGAAITRREFHIVPTRDLRNLWNECEVQSDKSKKIHIRITVTGQDENNKQWDHGMEITYGGPEFVHCRPIGSTDHFPQEVNQIVYLPPLSGVQTSEKQLALGAQLHAVGEGRPGEILRTLLVELYLKNRELWGSLQKELKRLFQVELEDVDYNSDTDPDIAVYFRQILPNEAKGSRLEIANGGSGFLQFLLLASFLYSRKNSILLVDEPDSHMHIFLQREAHDWLKKLALKNKCQLIISTHSEVLVNNSDLGEIVTFFGKVPKPLSLKKDCLNQALNRLSPLQILNMEWKRKIVFVEGETDRKILQAWASVLEHKVVDKLESAYFEFCHTDQIGDACRIFQIFCEIIPFKLGAFCLRDSTTHATKNLPSGFEVYSWNENEIENYLLYPASLTRFAASRLEIGPLFQNSIETISNEYLKDNLPPKFFKDPINNSLKEKGSDFLENYFKQIKLPFVKGNYSEIALRMKKEEIKPEVVLVLDKLDAFLK